MAGTRIGCFGGRYGVSQCVCGKHFHIYILILPSIRFLPIRGVLVGFLFCLPPSRPCLVGGAVPEQVAEPCSKSLSRAELQIPVIWRIASSPTAPGEQEPPSCHRCLGSPPGRVLWGQPTLTRAQGAHGGRGDPARGAAGLLEAFP